jgi:hypothetical protein
MHFKAPRLLQMVLVLALCAGVAAAAEKKWTPLFDGKTFTGWKPLQGTAKYEIRDGAIIGIVTEGVPQNSFLTTEEVFGDFIFECEFKAAPGINSGVQFPARTSRAPSAGTTSVSPRACGWSRCAW